MEGGAAAMIDGSAHVIGHHSGASQRQSATGGLLKPKEA
jgi:hypothetical protein